MRLLTSFLLSHIVSAVLGPMRIYQSLFGQTYNLTDPVGNEYSIRPYAEILLQPGLSLGTYQTYSSVANQYVYHSYTGGSTSGGCGSGRSFALELNCAPTLLLDTVIENPSCYYSSTLYTPAVCGVDMTVGQEVASATQTPTPTTTPMGVFTMFPSASTTATRTPSTTPLFMISAWPTTTPLNVSPSSTPLFYMTAYPSYDPNNSSLPFVGLLSSATGTTATILGAVAVGGIGLVGIVFVIKHFRNGGSVKDLGKIFMANRGKINSVLSKVPGVPDSLKKAIADPNSILSPEARKMLAVVSDPHATIDKLDLPDSVKAEMKKHMPADADELINKLKKKTVEPEPVLETADVEDESPTVPIHNSVVKDTNATTAIATFVEDTGVPLTHVTHHHAKVADEHESVQASSPHVVISEIDATTQKPVVEEIRNKIDSI